MDYTPSLGTLRKIAEALYVTPAFLIKKDIEMKLHKGDVFKDDEGTLHKIYSTIDNTYTYVFLTNESTNTAIKMLPTAAEEIVKRMKLVKSGEAK